MNSAELVQAIRAQPRARLLDESSPTALLRLAAGSRRPLPCFCTLNLRTGDLWIAWTGEFEQYPPWAVALTWSLRWPVAPLPAARANGLLQQAVPHARELLRLVSVAPADTPTSTTFVEGAGACVDAIQLICAATFDDPDRLRP